MVSSFAGGLGPERGSCGARLFAQPALLSVTGENGPMKQIRFTLCAIVFLLSLPVGAQETTDFSGVWQMDLSRSDSAHQAVPIGPVTLIIKQNAAELSIET